jgi:mono/diheme cytochrome c family protein
MEQIMKLRVPLLLTVSTIVLAACNLTLAEDVTPPPNYVSPTPAPTMGPLFPVQAPSTENGAAIFAQKCAPCHGKTGMGDGPQGIQLGVTVPAFGLPEVARPASLAQWYTMVTQGNMERFMPPFASLSDQERWDVVAYAITLHISKEQIAKGKELFEANCANCSTDFFKDEAKMSALSEVELARIIKQGNENVKAFGSKLGDDDVWAVAAYLRTLPFDTESIAAVASTATSEAVTVTETPGPANLSTAVPEGTLVGAEQVPATSGATAVAKAGFGTVSGSVENHTGTALPSDMKVTLHGFDHGTDPSAGPQEVLTQEGTLNADGSFVFENIEMPLNRIFTAEITDDGTNLQSDYAIVKQGDISVSVPPIKLYNKSTDTSKLVVDETRIFFEYGTDNTIQVFNVYSFHNPTDKTIIVTVDNGQVPFIKAPEGSSNVGYEPMQDSEKFLQTQNGFAIPPSKNAYGLIGFASVAQAKEWNFSQEFVLPIPTLTVFVPEGVTIKNDKMSNLGVQAVQNFTFQIYELDGVGAGEKVTFGISGTPKDSTTTSSTSTTEAVASNKNLLLGAGALGLALILAGAWMYLRDRNHAEETNREESDDDFESSEEVIDAIIALDDSHRAKKISDETYRKRRAELKDILKEKM